MFTAIILGILEGLTEFLPISSTGHLILANRFFDYSGDFRNLFNVVIQAGAILAVIIYFRDTITPFGKDKKKIGFVITNWKKVLAAFFPAAVLGFFVADLVDQYLFNALTVAIALIVGGMLLIIAERMSEGKEQLIGKLEDISYKEAVIIGLFQCLALVPGMSRSGSTIIGGLFRKFSRDVAAQFSFLLAIPTILAASGYKLFKYRAPISTEEVIYLLVGTFVSFITAYLVIAFFMNYIRNKNYRIFAYYRILLGVIVLLVIKYAGV